LGTAKRYPTRLQVKPDGGFTQIIPTLRWLWCKYSRRHFDKFIAKSRTIIDFLFQMENGTAAA
jgi:hypothetical protein